MSDICQAIPQPTPVTIGGRPFLASELRLGDLSLLSAYVKSLVPSPYDVAEPFLASNPGGIHWKRLLAETYEAQRDWPPDLSSEEADSVLSTADGYAYFAWVVLRREHPGMTSEGAKILIAAATLAEYRRLVRVAWATNPMAMIARLVDGPPRRVDGSPQDWTKCWYEYGKAFPNGPRFEDLTLTQFSAFLGEGDLPSPEESSGSVDEVDFSLIRKRREFWQELDEADAAEAGGGA